MVNKSSRESSEIPILLSLKKMMIVFWLGREGAHETHREERALTLKSLTLSKKRGVKHQYFFEVDDFWKI